MGPPPHSSRHAEGRSEAHARIDDRRGATTETSSLEAVFLYIGSPKESGRLLGAGYNGGRENIDEDAKKHPLSPLKGPPPQITLRMHPLSCKPVSAGKKARRVHFLCPPSGQAPFLDILWSLEAHAERGEDVDV